MDFQSSPKTWKRQVVYSFFLCSWGWVSGQLHYSVAEESEPGTVVGNVAQDLGLNLIDISKHRLHLESEGSRIYFTVNQGSGSLIVKEKIDRESLCGTILSCFLHIEVVSENPFEVFSVEIEILDINDNSPIFSTVDHVIKITEVFTGPGVHFPLETAQDKDVGVNGISQYRLNSNPFFSLSVKNRKDGTLVPQLILEKPLDREEIQKHKLILTAYDGGEKPRSGSCQITIIVLDINDNGPVFDQSTYKIKLKENLPFKTVIMKLNATDLDEGPNGEIEYAFDDHTEDFIKELFNLNQQSGEIYVKGILDFEDTNFYELSFKAKDKGVPALEGRCLIQIEVEDENDNPPEIFFTSLRNEVPENSNVGTAIGFIILRDKDAGKNGEVNLTLSPQLPFEFKPLNNRYSLVTNGFLDREKIPQYTIQLIATDLGSPPLWTQITIMLNVSDVNDNPPVFLQSSYSVFIKENNEPGAFLCTVDAFDPDEGVNSELVYSLVDSQIDGSFVSSFVYINPKDGNIYAQNAFNYERIQVLHIFIRVEDSGFPKLFSNVSVIIFILDANDHHPSVLYPEQTTEHFPLERIPVSASAGYLVTKVSAVDLDSGHNAWLLFSLIETTDSSLFKVSPHTGEIRTLRNIEDTDNSEQKLVISVSDHGDPPLSTSVTLLVNIVDNIIKESHNSHYFLTNVKPTSDLTLYLIISLVAISLVSLVTFLILLARCRKKENHECSKGCCFLSSTLPTNGIEQYQPTLYLNTDGTLKYMEVRMVPTESQGQFYQSCLPSATEKPDLTPKNPLNFPQLKDLVSEMEPSDMSWVNEPNLVNKHCRCFIST